MRAIEKAGWTALGLTLLALLVALAIFTYTGPAKIQRDIVRLSSADVYEAVFPKAIALFEALSDRDSLAQGDARGRPINDITAPVPYTFISKDGNSLNLHFGGGFLSFGYRLEKTETESYRLVLEVEEKPDRILKEK